tara:strand:+ start:377 stop:523 length:147 start_codon:yes stop_codon:yes gene_type:complete
MKATKKFKGTKIPTASNSTIWYNTGWVWFWLIFFWPVGLYGLIKRFGK